MTDIAATEPPSWSPGAVVKVRSATVDEGQPPVLVVMVMQVDGTHAAAGLDVTGAGQLLIALDHWYGDHAPGVHTAKPPAPDPTGLPPAGDEYRAHWPAT